MKPEPDPQSDGKRSKSRRSFAKETRADDVLEKDLWDLDAPAAEAAADSGEPEPDDAPEIAEIPETPAAETPESGDSEPETDPEPEPESEAEAEPGIGHSIPIVPRSTRRDLVFKQSSPKKRAIHKLSKEERPLLAKEATEEFSNRITASAATDDTFDDLDAPDDAPPVAKISTKTDGSRGEEIETSAGEEVSIADVAEIDPDTEPPAAIPTPSQAVKDLSKGLSKVERMGLLGFLLLLAGGVIFFFSNSINKLPEEQKPLTPKDLPIAGNKISADKISSYWREPDTAGGETFRRGTLLLPVVELGVSGGPAAVRVFFRDSDGATVGDGVTRAVNGGSTVTIAATAGFDDQGMFAAYRTGETKPWKIEVFEGPSTNASGSEFKKLFEMPISTQRR